MKYLPGRGEIGIFNRSHYEEVLVVRVHPENLDRQRLPPQSKRPGVWERRYREINDWEHYLADNGFVIVKLFLNLSKEEQRIRFLKRLDLADTNWKFRERHQGARLLGRLPEGLLRDAVNYQHGMGPLVRDPGRPQVVRADLRVGDSGRRADAHRSSNPTVSAEARRGLEAARAELEAEAPKGAGGIR